MATKRPRLTAFDRGCFGDGCPALVGVDEAGRGAFAGPVVAAAMWVREAFYETSDCRRIRPGIRDSKMLTEEEREAALANLEKCRDAGGICFAAGIASVEEIAEVNILGATRLAMTRALDEVLARAGCDPEIWMEAEEGDLFFEGNGNGSGENGENGRERRGARPLILVDGKPLRPFRYPHRAVVKGDGRSFAIAAASIVAKVTRDRLMRELHEAYPVYGFDSNKGYGTPRHVEAIQTYGTSPLHREKFLRKLMAAGVSEGGDTEELELDGVLSVEDGE